MRQLWAKYRSVPRNLEPLEYIPNNDLKVHAPKEAKLQWSNSPKTSQRQAAMTMEATTSE